MPFFQPKLTVNAPGDAYEQEADRVADQVMRMRDGDAPIVQRMALTPVNAVQRRCAECEKEEVGRVQRKETGGQSAPTIVSGVLASGGGRPLDAGARQFMESRFGQDFGQVRIHTDGKAAESAAAIQARAYTRGRDIVFGKEEYRPESAEGRRLLAHELVHVGQQHLGIHQGAIQRTVEEPATASITPTTATSSSAACSGIPPSRANCSAYAAQSSWLPDSYIFNATCACQETPNEPKANCIRKELQNKLAVRAVSPLATRAARMKAAYNAGSISFIDYNAFVLREITPTVHADHVAAYRTAGCPSGPAAALAWDAVTTIPMMDCTAVKWSIFCGGGSCYGNICGW